MPMMFFVVRSLFFVCFFLQQNATFRDEQALVNKHKKIVQELRIFSSWQRRNALRTGGGPPEPKPAGIKIECTGALLELQQIYGHALCGMDGFDCDGISNETIQLPQNETIQLPQDETIQLPQDEIPPSQLFSDDGTASAAIRSSRQLHINELMHSFVDDSEIQLDPITAPIESAEVEVETDLIRTVPLRVSETVTSDSAQTASTPKHTNHDSSSAAAVPELSQQFFPTGAQQRRRRQNQQQQNNNDQKQSNAELLELRQQFVIDEREHYRVKHELAIQNRRDLHTRRLEALSSENQARLAEFRKRNEIRHKIAAKQLLFWEVAMDLIRNRPRSLHEVQQSAAISGEVHALNEAVMVAEQADDAV